MDELRREAGRRVRRELRLDRADLSGQEVNVVAAHVEPAVGGHLLVEQVAVHRVVHVEDVVVGRHGRLRLAPAHVDRRHRAAELARRAPDLGGRRRLGERAGDDLEDARVVAARQLDVRRAALEARARARHREGQLLLAELAQHLVLERDLLGLAAVVVHAQDEALAGLRRHVLADVVDAAGGRRRRDGLAEKGGERLVAQRVRHGVVAGLGRGGLRGCDCVVVLFQVLPRRLEG